MSDSITIARPYAKAIFEHALEKKQLDHWSEYLKKFSFVVLDSRAEQFITNPASTVAEHATLLTEVAGVKGKESDIAFQFITVLAHNKRLLVLPEILSLFEALKAQHQKNQAVDVVSFSALTKKQEEQLKESLAKRLGRDVTLQITIDKTILGGAVIHAGDLVIDGSVRGKLNKLATSLAA